MHHANTKIRCRALITHDDRLLVCKHDESHDYYALPGGKLEKGENPLECIKREILEELGVEIVDPKLVYVYRWVDYRNEENIEFFFLIKDGVNFVDFINNARTHDFEIFDSKWINKQDDINLLPTIIKTEFAQNGFDFEGVRFI